MNRTNILDVLIAVHTIVSTVYSNIDLANMFFISSQKREIIVSILSRSAFLYKICVPAFLTCQERGARNQERAPISVKINLFFLQ